MHLPQSARIATELIVLDESPSTNARLLDEASTRPHFTVVATSNQTAGRGRLGRSWVAPAGRTLAASVLVRGGGEAELPVRAFGWLPLLAGLAMSRAIGSFAPASVKWPNDVLIGDRKVCGVLAELAPDGRAVVIGTGVNIALRDHELPVPTATSLALEGIAGSFDELADAVLAGYLARLRSLVDRLAASSGDAIASGLRDEVADACGSIGRRVRVELPDGAVVHGSGSGLDADGRLEVAVGGGALAVTAGDVTHLRYE